MSLRNAGRVVALALLGVLVASEAYESFAATPPKGRKPDAAARRLEDIRIEGDVPVPQVIFVTARDPRRFLDFQHRRYLKSSAALRAEVVPPSRVHLVGPWPTFIHKESAP